jgi:hypothetical protein
MKREEVKGLVREHIVLRKRIASLQEELKGLEDRYEEVGELLYGYRSRTFIRSVLHCLADMEKEYAKDPHFDDFLSSIINILNNFEEYDENRKNYTPKDQLYLYDEKVE